MKYISFLVEPSGPIHVHFLYGRFLKREFIIKRPSFSKNQPVFGPFGCSVCTTCLTSNDLVIPGPSMVASITSGIVLRYYSVIIKKNLSYKIHKNFIVQMLFNYFYINRVEFVSTRNVLGYLIISKLLYYRIIFFVVK